MLKIIVPKMEKYQLTLLRIVMDKLDRLYQLHQLLSNRRTPVTLAQLAEKMECSEKTVKRYKEQLQLYFNAPLEYLPHKGWQIIPGKEDLWELPGLWLTDQDVQSLLLLLDILQRFGNGLLSHELQATETKVSELLERRGIRRSDLQSRIKIIPVGYRNLPNQYLRLAFQALVQKQRLQIIYSDYSGAETQRVISPQRLTYYRDNWYLDAWCHQRNNLRTFSLSRIKQINSLEESAKHISSAQIDAHFSSGFGLFAGVAKKQAVLRFLPPVAREISSQQWHPEQQGEWDGCDYLLTLPFSQPNELIQDIQRHLPYVVIESPAEFKKQLIKHLQLTIAQHEKQLFIYLVPGFVPLTRHYRPYFSNR